MSVIAVFSDAKSIHLIADTLISEKITNIRENKIDKWLSTGVFLGKEEQRNFEFSEGILKICKIQNNLAIGFAGYVKPSYEALNILSEQSKGKNFKSFLELKDFLFKSVIPSVTPSKEFALCGFMRFSGVDTKFKLVYIPNRHIEFESSTDRSTVYSIGSGREDFDEIWRRVPSLQNRLDVDSLLTFSLIAEHLYLKQFIREIDMITKRYIGGAITGMYCREENISWQPSRAVITFANVGGTGLDARFEWLRLVYKTWPQDGNVFSSSMFEQNGHFFQRITQYSNPLSKHVRFSEHELLPDMKTFNAETFHIILLPKGINNLFPAVIRVTGKLKAFDEIIEDKQIVGLRLNKQFFEQISNEFFVTPEYTIKIGIERLEPLVNALRKRLQTYPHLEDPTGFVKLQSELGVRLMELGGKTDNIVLLSEALGNFLSAWDIAKKQNLPLLDDTIYNVSQFLSDLKKNLNRDQLSLVLEGHETLLSEYNKHEN